MPAFPTKGVAVPDSRKFHFWLDYETTGLVPQVDNVLEIAWTITDENLAMVAPLRSRLACLAPKLDSARISRHLYHPLLKSGTRSNSFVPDDDDTVALLPDVVREMHETSGLLRDLTDAQYGKQRKLMIREPRDFERLLLEDLAAIGFDENEGDRLVISGAGVSHFDVYVLAEHWPEMFPLMPGPGDVATYWQHDTSVAWRVLGESVQRLVRDLKPAHAWSAELVACEAGVDDTVSHLVTDADFGGLMFDRAMIRPHRAADDVVASLLDARLLRHLPELPGLL